MSESLETKKTKPKEDIKPAEQNVDTQAAGAKAEMTALLGGGASACDAVSGCAEKKELTRVIDDPETHTRTVLDSKGRPLVSYVFGKPVEVSEDDDEEVDIDDYYSEREKDSQLTPEKYLRILAQQLNTPEKLHDFLQEYMEYIPDPKVKGKIDSWNTAEEIVQRVKDGKMLGDCDDYAFLAQKILNLQGHNARVLILPGHAICVWVEKKGEKYFGYSVGSQPLDKVEDNSLEGVLNKLLKASENYADDPEGKPYTVKDKKIVVGINAGQHLYGMSLPIEVIEDPKLYSVLVALKTEDKGQHLDDIELFDRTEAFLGLLKDNPKGAEYISSCGLLANFDERLSSLRGTAESAMKRKDFVLAEKIFRKIISLPSREAGETYDYSMFIKCLIKGGKMQEAEVAFDGLIQRNADVSFAAYECMRFLKKAIIKDGIVSCNKSFLDKVYKVASVGQYKGINQMYATCLFALGYEKEARTLLRAVIITDEAKRITGKLMRGREKTD